MRLIKRYRVIVFAPAVNVKAILKAVREVATLRYGNYVGVSWTSGAGQERFTPTGDAKPKKGTKGIEKVEKICRIEFSIARDRRLLRRVITEAVYPNHDWEEPVISVIEVQDAQKAALSDR